MDGERSIRLREVFQEALQRPSALREEYLIAACDGDGELRTEVESLLAASDSAGGFLADPEAPVHPPAAKSERAASPAEPPAGDTGGTRIGRYTLLEPLGEGGFGVVYLAEQRHPVRRRVALKLIKPGMDSRQVVARFEAERQALALMDHPGIARVFDGGATDAGHPYFVMELVQGPPLTRYCDENKLDLPRRLELFARVCDAVHHAHQKGVIHRDLKPTNVLVAERDGQAVPKVIDFGVAKAVQGRLTEHSLHTEQRQLVGTPEYMSPEQAAMGAAAVDTRSDVYSLGVLLYELLTGATPFDAKELRSKSVGEVERILREVEPPSPSDRVAGMNGEAAAASAARRATEAAKLVRLLRGELDWVVMRCLEKDPARRYESAAALAGDVRRHLEGDAVLARPTSAVYRVRVFVRRNRVGVAAAAALLLGVVGTTAGMLRARTAEQQAKADKALAESSMLRARTAEQQAKAGKALAESDAENARAAYDILRDIIEGANPVSRGGGPDTKVVDLLDGAVARLDARLGKYPEAELEARHAIVGLYSALGMYEKCHAVSRGAHTLARRHYGDDAPETLKWAEPVGGCLRELGKFDEAEQWLRPHLERARGRLGEGNVITRNLAQQLALCYLRRDRFDEAEEVYSQTLAVPPEIPPFDAKDRRTVVNPSYAYETTIRLLANYSELKLKRGRPAEAEDLARQALDASRECPAVDPLQPGRRALPDQYLADALAAQDKMKDAEEVLDRLIVFANRNIGSATHWRPHWVARHAELLTALRKFPEALRARQEMLDFARAKGGPKGAWVANATWDVADLMWLTGERKRAEEMNALADAAMGKTPGSRPAPRWLRAAVRPALGREEEWADPGFHAQVWGLADRLLYDLFDARAVAEEFETGWPGARFDLARWDGQPLQPGEAAGTKPVAAGSLSDAKRVKDLPPGLYRLSLEIPRRGDLPPLRGVAWVPLWQWDAQRYYAWGGDLPYWRQVLQNNKAPPRTLPSLVLAGGLTLHPGPGGYTERFSIVATSKTQLPAGTYLLRVTSADAVRVWVNDRRVAGTWTLRSASTDTGRVELQGGTQEWRVEFYNGSHEFNLRLEIEPVAPGALVPEAPDAELDYLAGKIARQPTDSGAWAGRGQVLARHRRFDEARKHLDRAIELGAGDVNTWHAAAALRLQAGDVEGYREHCRRMLEKFKDSKDRWVCHRVAETCVVAPGAVSGEDLKAASDLIDRALHDDAPKMEWRHRAYMELTRGIADYRRGHDAAAARLLRRAIERPMNNEMLAVNKFFLAMVCHRLGEQSQAQSLYNQGVENVEDIAGDELATPATGVLGSDTGWTMWVHAHAARREAAALIQAPAGAGVSTNPVGSPTQGATGRQDRGDATGDEHQRPE